MTTLFMRVMLFFCSYAPLVFIICILQIGKWPWWVIVLLACLLGGGSLVLTWGYFTLMRRTMSVTSRKLLKFSRHDSEVMGYISSYLVPFVSFGFDQWQQVVALLLFVLILLVIYVNSNMIYINPVLSLCGYHIYEIEVESSRLPHFYIARKPLELDHDIRFVPLSEYVYLEK